MNPSMTKWLLLISTTLIGLCLSSLALAQTTRYVTDQLEVDIRTGKSLQHRIVRMLPAGTEVTVLESDGGDGYSLVRTSGGVEGWILTRYLADTPIPREQLAQAQAELSRYQTATSELQSELDTLQRTTQALESSNAELRANNQQLSQELAEIRRTSANAIAIGQRNRELEQQMVNMERELQLVQQENQTLADDSRKQWFLLGAGVLLLGALLGWIGPRLRGGQRRTRWGDL